MAARRAVSRARAGEAAIAAARAQAGMIGKPLETAQGAARLLGSAAAPALESCHIALANLHWRSATRFAYARPGR